MKKIYMDYAATTPLLPEVLEEMKPYFLEKYANPSSIYSFGRNVKKEIEKAREEIAAFINADPKEIYFTSGGTESNNFALKGLSFSQKKHMLISSIEHHAILEPCNFLKRMGCEFDFIPVDEYGIVKLDVLKKNITDQTFLISVMHANNEIGTIQPIEEIAKIAKEKNILFHSDGVQTFGHIPIDVKKMNIDLFSASAHKLYGPKGVGLLYIKNGTKIASLLHGGTQESNRRASTLNVPGIIGFAKAVQIAKKQMGKENERLKFLRDKLIKGILSKIKKTKLNGHPYQRLANNINISFEYIEGESMLLHLDQIGICCSTGSACTSSTLRSSHVLLAIGIDPEIAHSSLRFTLGKYSEEKDIDYLLEKLPQIIENLRKLSPLGDK